MSITWYRGIVVGVDGSDESLAALDWAARAADLHDACLTAITTYITPMTPDPGIGNPVAQVRDDAERAAQAARARIGSRRPGNRDVEVLVLPGSAHHVLSQRSTTCDLVVVGRRGLGRLDRLLLGSTSAALAASAPGATVVVPAGATTGDPRRVRVGVDRNDEPDVLGAAFAEASARGCPLEVVHVSRTDPAASMLFEIEPFAQAWQEATNAGLADRVARWSEKYPRVTCTVTIRRGDRVPALLDDLTPDDLLVVGGRRHQPALGRMLGSVPDAVLRTAPCPVLVVHVRRPAPEVGSTSGC
ncbi:universal stress protein [Promicromonospora iranensis]|uniref:Nucleotide-binding universal stress UspA family protein n=1 Tax=Promicromonospora iranensis TaxID=1105144 RepID=A0ABU2CKD9_9MICO|nr:universal stress protein [Promicromonospora iranensis]MDR7381795.1 nucleotide-binding universal stress UspA family protein [Promicromonospora iranensis]